MAPNSMLGKNKTLLNNWKLRLSDISLKTILLFALIQFVVLVLAFIAFALIPVHREVKKLNIETNSKQNTHQALLSQSSIDLANKVVKAKHLESILTSTLKLAESDSISLLINLNDSLAILSFKGVFLFKSKISSIKLNKGLTRLPLSLLDSLFSGPFMVGKEISTIEKFPIIFKKAPKDTLEANLLNATPEIPKQTDVFWFFTFERNFAIELRQEEDKLIGTRRAYEDYKNTKANYLRGNWRKNIFNLDQTGYTYQLSIEIPREDARSIYRALPLKPQVLVSY